MIFDFEEWAQLAKQDRAAFERKRAATIREAIAETAHSERELRMLNGLQFRIDMLRRRHKSPLGACVAISNMLMHNVHQLVQMDINELYEQAQHPLKPTTSATVIPFTPRSKH
jgi:hypothetical protein